MESGRAVVTAPLWKGVHNHIGTFHAIACCNLAEVAMGMLAEATVPTTHRWLPKGMNVQYKGMADSSLTATAELAEIPDFDSITTGVDVVVPVAVTTTSGKEVVHADITIWVTPNKKKA